MKARNPAQQFKNKHVVKDVDADMTNTLFFTPPTTTSKIQSRTQLNISLEEMNQPFFTPDLSSVKMEHRGASSSSNNTNFCTRITKSMSDASIDSAKRLIYENRTIQHNFIRLQHQFCKEEEQHKRMKTAVAELRKKYDSITQGLKNRPKLREAPKRPPEIAQSPTLRINPKLMRKNTNALVKITQMKYAVKPAHTRDFDDGALKKLQQKLEAQRKQCDDLSMKNDQMREQIRELRSKHSGRYSEPQYLAKVARLEAENRDLHNIIKGLGEVLKTDRKVLRRGSER